MNKKRGREEKKKNVKWVNSIKQREKYNKNREKWRIIRNGSNEKKKKERTRGEIEIKVQEDRKVTRRKK